MESLTLNGLNRQEKSLNRNPGPSWGFRTIAFWDKVLPNKLGQMVLGIGTWVALVLMKERRKYSCEYLKIIFGYEANIIEQWRHFFAFSSFLVERLRMARGKRPVFYWHTDNEKNLNRLTNTHRSFLIGTFHVGYSDLLGFHIGDLIPHIYLLRLRMDNSEEVERMVKLFQKKVSIVWVNDDSGLIVALKQALESDFPVAMQCDRTDHSSKTIEVDFLGACRIFPFSIYHIGIIYNRPVAFTYAIPDSKGHVEVYFTEAFYPDSGSKKENLQRAQVHFQSVLSELESVLKTNPYMWFNFTELNPIAKDSK